LALQYAIGRTKLAINPPLLQPNLEIKLYTYGKLQQTRIRLDRSANTSSSQAPPTMRLSTVQDLIGTGWAARGISIPCTWSCLLGLPVVAGI
jgi:hypothetical protein